LFTHVCKAVQHAHQKGIIHRDLKPSNILVTLHDGVPVPKVIDFGIAKATHQELTDKTIHTIFRSFIGTPAYTSPEQAEMSGLDIDTRSDIYSLGVLLYELLTGKTPFDQGKLLGSGVEEMRRILREADPPLPSTRVSTLSGEERSTTAHLRGCDHTRLVQALRGDLDWIVLKCLEKDRERRYDTANGLALDIQRDLAREPVLARPRTTLYRLDRFVRRNKAAVIAASAVVLALALGAVVSTWQAMRATALREQAEVSREQALEAKSAALEQRRSAIEAQQRAEASESQARRNLYVAQMALAFEAFNEGNLGLARTFLSKAEEAAAPRTLPAESGFHTRQDLRGWEWRYLIRRAGYVPPASH
jgi:hypothetical protein